MFKIDIGKKLQRLIIFIVMVIYVYTVSGCSQTTEGEAKNLEYTVLGETEIPEELMDQINEKKAEDMKLSYKEGEYMYIARGYGEKKTGGYSISVDECYATDKAIYVKTSLTGPAANEMVSENQSFPYVVIKTEKLDKIVVFE